jgi:hypothetical protein
VLLGLVGLGIWRSNRTLRAEQAETSELVVRGRIGSEKEAFFADPRVREALHKHGLRTEVEKAGSRAIASEADATKYDFGFPSGAPAAAQLKALANASQVFTPFYTPIVFASWKPIAQILEANGVVRREGEIYYVTDLARLLALMNQGARWKELKGSEQFATNKAVLVSSTDVRSSNSAAMYLSLVSYVANGESIVQSQADVERVLPQVEGLFLRQGFQESSSASPFEDYLALGIGKTPLLACYESQIVELLLSHPERLQRGDIVMLYPKPTVYSKHVLVPFNEKGRKLGEALENDAELRALAHELGFRTGGEQHGPELWRKRGVQVPDTLVDVIDPPSFAWLERMIQAIEAKFQ